jgi:hypothetical protein
MTERKCRRCEVVLTLDNARTYQGRWVGACRHCESVMASERYHAKKAVA